jgi:hypothetical protein
MPPLSRKGTAWVFAAEIAQAFDDAGFIIFLGTRPLYSAYQSRRTYRVVAESGAVSPGDRFGVFSVPSTRLVRKWISDENGK